jgi:hypothetical protein
VYRGHAAVGGEGQGRQVRKESEQHDQKGRDLHVEAHGEKEQHEHHLHLLALENDGYGNNMYNNGVQE